MAYHALSRAAIFLVKANATSKADTILLELRKRAVESANAEKNLLGAIREIAEMTHNTDVEICAMERQIELAPDDDDLRFSLAYKHSEQENNDMALHHYLLIPYERRTAITWNNIGVAYDHFQMQGRAVTAYRTAEQMGETLAMSNLSNKLMRAGFLSEAKEELDKAIEEGDYHRNVGSSIARLKELPDEEAKKKDAVLEKVRPKVDFYRMVGRAIKMSDITILPESLHAPECELRVRVSDNEFRAEGEYEREATNSLAIGLFGGTNAKSKHRITFEGTITGHTIEGNLKRDTVGQSTYSLLGSGDAKIKFLMALDEDAGEIKVMEGTSSVNPRFYSIKIDG